MITIDRNAHLQQVKRDLDVMTPRQVTTSSSTPRQDRGRTADDPRQIPTSGWKDILLRSWAEVSENNIVLVAGGVTYAVLLALFPALAALSSSYMAGRCCLAAGHRPTSQLESRKPCCSVFRYGIALGPLDDCDDIGDTLVVLATVTRGLIERPGIVAGQFVCGRLAWPRQKQMFMMLSGNRATNSSQQQPRR